MTAALCSRCKTNPQAVGQRWCAPCRAESKRLHRKVKSGERSQPSAWHEERTRPPHTPQSPIQEPSVRPIKRRRPGPEIPTGWQEVFLEEVRRTGGFYKAAEAAGVHPKTATRWMNSRPEFQEAVHDARERHADLLEEELESMGRATGNPVPHIVRLKALRPTEYIEKRAVLTVSTTAQITQEEGRRLLAAMISQATSATLQALAEDSEGRKALEASRLEYPPIAEGPTP
jgi:hypothetical protein